MPGLMIMQKKAGNRKDERAVGIDLERGSIVKKSLYAAVASIMILCSACAGQGVPIKSPFINMQFFSFKALA